MSEFEAMNNIFGDEEDEYMPMGSSKTQKKPIIEVKKESMFEKIKNVLQSIGNKLSAIKDFISQKLSSSKGFSRLDSDIKHVPEKEEDIFYDAQSELGEEEVNAPQPPKKGVRFKDDLEEVRYFDKKKPIIEVKKESIFEKIKNVLQSIGNKLSAIKDFISQKLSSSKGFSRLDSDIKHVPEKEEDIFYDAQSEPEAGSYVEFAPAENIYDDVYASKENIYDDVYASQKQDVVKEKEPDFPPKTSIQTDKSSLKQVDKQNINKGEIQR